MQKNRLGNFPTRFIIEPIFDEPTKGIDVGAKSEIYDIISKLAQAGKTILIVSSEIPELLGTCDRIYVFHEGQITGELNIADYDDKKDQAQELIMKYATATHQDC